MAQHTVPATELAIKALQCPEGKARAVYHIDGHGNDGLKLYVESSGTKTWYFRARVRGSDPKDTSPRPPAGGDRHISHTDGFDTRRAG